MPNAVERYHPVEIWHPLIIRCNQDLAPNNADNDVKDAKKVVFLKPSTATLLVDDSQLEHYPIGTLARHGAVFSARSIITSLLPYVD